MGRVGQVGRAFYDRPTLEVARDLLGKVLVRCTRSGRSSGMIVEVEAYIGEGDPACHAAPGPTRRNEPLYGPPGHAYIYLNYGIHALFNVVTEEEGMPAAVLIRALDPADGIDGMRRRRRLGTRRAPGDGPSVHDLCRGPGNLTCALGITLGHNRVDLLGDRLFVEDHGHGVREIGWGPRIGITRGVRRPWRAWIAGHPAVSRPGTLRTPLSDPKGPSSSKMFG
jgi:DNA-3-methyladenine glycosylase